MLLLLYDAVYEQVQAKLYQTMSLGSYFDVWLNNKNLPTANIFGSNVYVVPDFFIIVIRFVKIKT